MPNSLEEINTAVEVLLGAGKLEQNQAKTLVYYCILTCSNQPRIRPIIELNGESGTGKNGIMKQMEQWCNEPKWINARGITPAQLRDELADTTTAFIEEADKTTGQRESENWYQQRYQDTGERIGYRRQIIDSRGRSIYSQERHNHFGYTILHTQTPFQSSEMDSRTLRITIFKDSSRDYQGGTLSTGLPYEIVNEIDWSKEIEGALSNSAWDVWLPLMRLADHLGDTEFLDYARGQIVSKTEEDDLSKVYEPKGVVLSEIAPIYEICLKDGQPRIAITDVRQKVLERGYVFNERQIVKLAKELGFTIYYPGNKAHLKVNSESELRRIFERAGVGEHFSEDGDSEELILHSVLAV